MRPSKPDNGRLASAPGLHGPLQLQAIVVPPPPEQRAGEDAAAHPHLLRRFWRDSRSFWRLKDGHPWAWPLAAAVLAIVLVQLFLQYQITVWNRLLFDALEQKHAAQVLHQALTYVPLAAAGVFFSIINVYCRMTMQRLWRERMTHDVIDRWMAGGRHYHLNWVAGDHQNAESRIVDDIRNATEAPVDIIAGILAAVLSAATFIVVLWSVGGNLSLRIAGTQIDIPAFLVIAAFIYAMFATGSMLLIGRSFVRVFEEQNQREAEFRYALTRLRENGESIALLGGEKQEREALTQTFRRLLESWRLVMGQWMRTTFVSSTSSYVAAVLPILLCAPKYLGDEMSLGEVMQAASAFVIVQAAFGWLVDNYPRYANWSANARRIASLTASLDALEHAERTDSIKLIVRDLHDEDKALQLRGLSVTHDHGTGVVHDVEVNIESGEKVLVVGQSGTGKSTLVRAIAGLWPWGEGQVRTPRSAKLLMLPQRPYIPLGSLRRAVIYPIEADQVSDATVHDALQAVGLGDLRDRLDDDAPWEQTLSASDKQRLAFARLLIHKPDMIVLDEATSALRPDEQDQLMRLIHEQLPAATVVTVGHRPELEALHDRTLVLNHQAHGERVIRDEHLEVVAGPEFVLTRTLRAWRRWWSRRPQPAGKGDATATSDRSPVARSATSTRQGTARPEP